MELVHSELDWRLKSGEPARVEDYILAFPDLNRDRDALVDLLAAEWTIRRRSEPTLGGEEYQSRFPGLYSALLDHMTRGSTGLRPTLPLARPASATPDEAAMRLPAMFDRFELRELVGQGTFGRVYRAWDTEMRQYVALKLPRLGPSASPADVQTFLREARNASGLRHPNIVQMFEAARHEGTAYMVTEFVEGRTLADVLRDGPPHPDASAELMMTILDALDYAHSHEKRVIHRDLKPSNILIDSRGRPHLTDFGLAQRDGGDGSSVIMSESLLVGTLAYMSPEQVLGRTNRVDARSDVFAAGVVLYELLTGELPFRGRGRMLQAQIVDGEPVSPRRLNDLIPEALESICQKALAKSPADRFPSARAMADQLQLYLSGEAIEPAAAPGPWSRAGRWAATYPLRAALLAYAVVAGVALPILVVSSVRAVRRTDDPTRATGKAPRVVSPRRRPRPNAAGLRGRVHRRRASRLRAASPTAPTPSRAAAKGSGTTVTSASPSADGFLVTFPEPGFMISFLPTMGVPSAIVGVIMNVILSRQFAAPPFQTACPLRI